MQHIKSCSHICKLWKSWRIVRLHGIQKWNKLAKWRPKKELPITFKNVIATLNRDPQAHHTTDLEVITGGGDTMAIPQAHPHQVRIPKKLVKLSYNTKMLWTRMVTKITAQWFKINGLSKPRCTTKQPFKNWNNRDSILEMSKELFTMQERKRESMT